VPIDLSEYSLEAVKYARELVSGKETQIYLLHVISVESQCALPVVDQGSESVLREIEEVSLAQLETLNRKKICNARNIAYVIRRGLIFREIVKFAKDEKIDLIVMATHGRTGIRRALIGSVAEKVITHSAVPVLAVKPQLLREALLNENEIEVQLHSSQGENNNNKAAKENNSQNHSLELV
jgi:nucleotide-binding universal stress UspA family protein